MTLKVLIITSFFSLHNRAISRSPSEVPSSPGMEESVEDAFSGEEDQFEEACRSRILNI